MGKQERQQQDGSNALPSLNEPQKLVEIIKILSSSLVELLNPKGNVEIEIPPSLHAQLLVQLVNPIEHGSKGAGSSTTKALVKSKSQKTSKTKHPNPLCTLEQKQL